MLKSSRTSACLAPRPETQTLQAGWGQVSPGSYSQSSGVVVKCRGAGKGRLRQAGLCEGLLSLCPPPSLFFLAHLKKMGKFHSFLQERYENINSYRNAYS